MYKNVQINFKVLNVIENLGFLKLLILNLTPLLRVL